MYERGSRVEAETLRRGGAVARALGVENTVKKIEHLETAEYRDGFARGFEDTSRARVGQDDDGMSEGRTWAGKNQ